jgi:uncharacterized peroxidase-related enzyme
MTWIKTVPPTPENTAVREALEAQRGLYPKEYGPGERGESRVHPLVANDSIVLSHSLLPDVMKHAFSTFGALMDPNLPLSRRQHEMIAATVSSVNRCFYWVESHAEFLRLVTLDDTLSAAIYRGEWRTADITDEEKVMLGYVEKLTRAPATVQRDDVEALREAGFDDTGILQINLIASWFNYINRVADGLGVGRE